MVTSKQYGVLKNHGWSSDDIRCLSIDDAHWIVGLLINGQEYLPVHYSMHLQHKHEQDALEIELNV